MFPEFHPKSIDSRQAETLKKIIAAALEAVDPINAIKSSLKLDGHLLTVGSTPYDLNAYKTIKVVGFGKAAPAMGCGLFDILGNRIAEGLLVCKHMDCGERARLPERVRCLPGNHPVPGENSLKSAHELAAFLSHSDAKTLVFCLISGGGSSLITLPQEGIGLNDLQDLTRLLLSCGADIGEINTLRKHLDRLKGGGLARLAYPATVISLIISDVVDSPLDVIASGPTAPDPSSYEQALDILKKYRLEDNVPPAILKILTRGLSGELLETLKPGDAFLEHVQNLVIGDNRRAALASMDKAREFGFETSLLTTSLTGEAHEAGKYLAGLLAEASQKPRPQFIAAGGETTVILRGAGLGGRNQEVALAAVEPLRGKENVALLTLGTDGEDGPTPAAGAVVSGSSWERAASLGLDPASYLKNNDSYHFFEAMGDLLATGPTGTNVNDLNFLVRF